jgi:SPP1 family predicted phage head-tail adaptor
MRAGALRHRVTIEEPIIEIDSDDGMQSQTWEPFASMISAEIVPLSGRELIAAQAVQSRVTTRIRIRNRPGVTAAMRVVHRQSIYNIAAIVPDPVSGTDYMTLMCETGVNEG